VFGCIKLCGWDTKKLLMHILNFCLLSTAKKIAGKLDSFSSIYFNFPKGKVIAVAKCKIEGADSDKKSENIFFYFGNT
jgi:hypothetical protein